MPRANSTFGNAITSRQGLKDYCMRKLGFPVIQINIDSDQVEDRIDDALQFFQDYHSDATEKVYISHRLQQIDVDRKYIDLSQISGVGSTTANSNTVVGFGTNFTGELSIGQTIQIGSEQANVVSIANTNYLQTDSVFTATNDGAPITNVTDAYSIIGVTKAYPLGDASTLNMFDLRYQMRLNDLYDFTSTSYVNYEITQQHLRMLEILFTGENPIRFNRHLNRVYIDFDWHKIIAVGEFILLECYKVVNPNLYTNVWNDRYLKAYATALIKRQWGENLSKYGGVALLGGVTLNGPQLFSQAEEEVTKLEEEIQSKFETPPEFYVG